MRERVGPQGLEAMIDFLRSVVDGPLSVTSTMKDRIRAAELIFDRGWGRAKQTVDINMSESIGGRPNFDALTDEQLGNYLDAVSTAVTKALPDETEDPDDV